MDGRKFYSTFPYISSRLFPTNGIFHAWMIGIFSTAMLFTDSRHYQLPLLLRLAASTSLLVPRYEHLATSTLLRAPHYYRDDKVIADLSRGNSSQYNPPKASFRGYSKGYF